MTITTAVVCEWMRSLADMDRWGVHMPIDIPKAAAGLITGSQVTLPNLSLL